MYTHTVYSATGTIISQTQRTSPLHTAPKKVYAKLNEQLIAERWDLRGTELFRSIRSNMDGAIIGKMQNSA